MRFTVMLLLVALAFGSGVVVGTTSAGTKAVAGLAQMTQPMAAKASQADRVTAVVTASRPELQPANIRWTARSGGGIAESLTDPQCAPADKLPTSTKVKLGLEHS